MAGLWRTQCGVSGLVSVEGMTTNIRDAVLAQLEEKINAGEALAAANAAVTDAQVHLTAVSAAAAKARQHALKAGWTEAELKNLGLIPTTRAARARAPRTPRPDTRDMATHGEANTEHTETTAAGA